MKNGIKQICRIDQNCPMLVDSRAVEKGIQNVMPFQAGGSVASADGAADASAHVHNIKTSNKQVTGAEAGSDPVRHVPIDAGGDPEPPTTFIDTDPAGPATGLVKAFKDSRSSVLLPGSIPSGPGDTELKFADLRRLREQKDRAEAASTRHHWSETSRPDSSGPLR